MPRKSEIPHRDLLPFLPEGASAVRHAFAAMGVAEEEIARANRLTKAQASRVFAVACPPAALASKSLELYRVHVRELCDRVASGAKLAPGTDAECLAGIADTSLIAPLESNAAAAYETLFARVFGKTPEGEPAGRERWPGAVAEIIAKLRQKMAVASRDQKE